MRRSQELNKFRYNTSSNDILNRWITFFGQQFSKLGGSIILLFDIIGIDSLDQDQQVGV